MARPIAPAAVQSRCRAARRAAAAIGAAAAAPAAAAAAFQPRRVLMRAAAEASSDAGGAAPSAAGRMTYRPESYAELVADAAGALAAGVAAGLTRMEVEFPPIPTNVDGALRRAAAVIVMR